MRRAIHPDGGQAAAVLITGASGFIGSHLLDRLIAAGRPVRCLVRSPDTRLPDSPVVDARVGDLLDPTSLRRAVDGVEVVYHLAGVATATPAGGPADRTVMVNVVGILNLLEAARLGGVRWVVLVSSSHVYGPPVSVPVAEDAALDPQSSCAATKLAAEKLALHDHGAFGLPTVILGPFNVFGPGQSVAAVIPTIIVQALAHQSLARKALRPRRDFVFVGDVVDGLLRPAAAPGVVGRVFNLRSGGDVSVAELARRIFSLAGSPLPPPEPPLFGDDSDRVVADTRLARAVMGWEASTTLDEGLRQTVNWWCAAKDGRAE